MSIKTRVKENPVVATLISVAAVVVALTSIWSGVEFADNMILTEAEAGVIHVQYDQNINDLEDTIEKQSTINTCRWLSDRVDSLKYEIYVLERDNASPDFIQSKRTQLDKMQRKFDILECAAIVT